MLILRPDGVPRTVNEVDGEVASCSVASDVQLGRLAWFSCWFANILAWVVVDVDGQDEDVCSLMMKLLVASDVQLGRWLWLPWWSRWRCLKTFLDGMTLIVLMFKMRLCVLLWRKDGYDHPPSWAWILMWWHSEEVESTDLGWSRTSAPTTTLLVEMMETLSMLL